jgi:hypothetical protein
MDLLIQHQLTIFGVHGGDYSYGLRTDGDGMIELSYDEPDRPEIKSIVTITPDDFPAFLKALEAFGKFNGYTGEET